MSSRKLIYEVTVSVSSSRSFPAASKTPISKVETGLLNPLRLVGPSLYSLYHRFSRFQFLPVGWYKMNQTVIKESQSCLWDRVIWILYGFTFIFTHLADAFIQRNLQCIQVIHLLSVCVFPRNLTHDLCTANAMLYH